MSFLFFKLPSHTTFYIFDGSFNFFERKGEDKMPFCLYKNLDMIQLKPFMLTCHYPSLTPPLLLLPRLMTGLICSMEGLESKSVKKVFYNKTNLP